MSRFEVKVYQIAVEPHPQADRLEVGRIPGQAYQFVVGKGQFQSGDLFVYIPEQAVLPDPLIEELGLVGRLAGAEGNRVKAQKLRGVLSQGLAYRPAAWPSHWTLGTEVAKELGIVKWEAPIPAELTGQVTAVPEGTIFRGYTDIENWQRWPAVLQPAEPVIYTEKVHGTCLVAGLFRLDGTEQRVVSSLGLAQRYQALVESDQNVYWRAVQQQNLFARLGRLLDDLGLAQVLFYGEVLGTQDLKYGLSNGRLRLLAFDLATQAGFLPWPEFVAQCARHGLERVPVLAEGGFDEGVLRQLADGPSTLAGHLREGVVVRPLVEREDLSLGRVILKQIGGSYLTRKGGMELH